MNTKQLSLTLILFFSFSLVFSQDKLQVKYGTVQSLLVDDISKANSRVEAFLEKYQLTPEKYIKKKNEILLNLVLEESQFFELKESIKDWGYINTENTQALSLHDSIQNIINEISILKDEKNQYNKLVMGIDSTSNERYFDYWEKIITIDKKIALLELRNTSIERKNKKFTFDLKILEERSSSSFYGNSWINMPGLEYSILFTEQSVEGLSPKHMQGVALKYMFNWYKSYGVLGLYTNPNPSADTEIDETYIFAYGQDFYARSLGRGQRKFLNLYSSFNLGVYVATSDTDRTTSWFVNPFLGIEIYKNKRILIDNKVGYFLPYKSNRIQRGLLYNFSFNFIL